MFGTVRAVIELIFLYGKKRMKRSGVCERQLAVLVFSVSLAKLPNTTPYCGQTEGMETQVEEELIDPSSLSSTGICRRKRKSL